ncbi:MAG: Stp1/IreP family PP2C-type Ser/Thr phosphatase [Deltaproteobacteria bacterium]|nr:Stp1/IreP family PP2C-type Ser/Thr phosphatase [Deltaproteobacteria bacterium]
MSGGDPQLIESASLSDVGQVRSSNQDYCDDFLSPSGNRLLVVADGMGGHRGGATASRIATETIGEVFMRATEESSEILYEALTEANRRVHQQSIDDPELRGMGTTVVALLFDTEGCVWVAHVGDSRAYRLHADGMEQITQDHSVVGEMVRRGLITAEEAEVHPRRNEILRSVGVEGQVEIDVAQVVTAPGDFFILCSDGLTGLVSDLEIARIVQSETPENAARQLVDLANDLGGHDNITVQVARVPSDETQSVNFDQSIQPDEPEAVPYGWIAGLAAAFIVLIVTYLTVSGDNPEPEVTNSPTAPIEAVENQVLP